MKIEKKMDDHKAFKIYHNDNATKFISNDLYSLTDIKNLNSLTQSKMVFTLANMEEDLENTCFYQFKVIKFEKDGIKGELLQINDISSTIRYQKLVSEKKTLESVNATVSHEMRNPLNSIIAQNISIRDCIKTFKNFIDLNPQAAQIDIKREIE